MGELSTVNAWTADSRFLNSRSKCLIITLVVYEAVLRLAGVSGLNTFCGDWVRRVFADGADESRGLD